MADFPIQAPAFSGRSRTVSASAAFEWLRLGWGMFAVNPGVWVAATLIVIVGSLALSIAGQLGSLLASLLTPPVTAGMLAMCRQASERETCEINELAAGFRTNASPLLILGLIFVLTTLAFQLFIFAVFGGSLMSGMMMQGMAGLGLMIGGGLFALLLSLILLVPLSMAMWFAPALVFFNNMPPVEALKASFNACLKNTLPFTILGLVALVLAFFAALPMGLGFLVFFPVLAGTLYASYQDIFVAH